MKMYCEYIFIHTEYFQSVEIYFKSLQSPYKKYNRSCGFFPSSDQYKQHQRK